MKQETAAAKFAALFGIEEKVEEVKIKSTGKLIGVSEDEIQKYREAQGLWYFLQAPALFTMKRCKRNNCGEIFAVSRKYVAFCSYDCIRLDLKDQGIDWNRRRNYDIEALVMDPDVYEGNEPIWIRESVLQKLREMDTLTSTQPITSSTPPPVVMSDPEPTSESLQPTESLPTSSTDSTMPSPLMSGNSAPSKKPKKRITSFKAS